MQDADYKNHQKSEAARAVLGEIGTIRRNADQSVSKKMRAS
jgi:hypothetical protein